MNFLKMMYSIFCQGLIASHLTRRGKWESARKLMSGNPK